MAKKSAPHPAAVNSKDFAMDLGSLFFSNKPGAANAPDVKNIKANPTIPIIKMLRNMSQAIENPFQELP